MKSIVVSLVLLFLSVQVQGQAENKVVQADELVWFGLDCSKLKLIGFTGSPEEVVGKYFMAWNTVVVQENEKYDLAGFFQKSRVSHDLAWISELNDKRDPSDLKAYKNQNITTKELTEHIQNY